MLTSTFPLLRSEHYARLAKLLIQNHPDVAQSLISTYFPHHEAAEKDLTKIHSLFLSFCKIEGIEPDDYRGNLYKTSKVNKRRLFIAIILSLYCPEVFHQPTDNITVKIGLVTKLADVIKQRKYNVSILVREVIIWKKNYEDFSEMVQTIMTQIQQEESHGRS